ncbi:hypothetical protein ACMHYC_10840 [Acinetobacter courvalinii]|uniref:hypothetical protein n=1 Tax=Acinetobacter courvalinii TaxID=280147 RepID=UPI0039C9FACF
MRKKKFNKMQFYKRLEAQDLSDPINLIKFKASLALATKHSSQVAKRLNGVIQQIQIISLNVDRIISIEVASKAIVKAITEDRIRQIIYGK